MVHARFARFTPACLVCIVALSLTSIATAQVAKSDSFQYQPSPNKGEAMNRFIEANPTSGFAYSGTRVSKIYGPAFAHGNTVDQSVKAFTQQHSQMWGVAESELAPIGRFEDSRHTQPIMYNPETDSYKFTGVYFTQRRDNVPVFRSELILLVRNEPGYPMVLATSSLRDLGNFQVAAAAALAAPQGQLINALRNHPAVGPQAVVHAQETVIWAGVEDMEVPPVLAKKFVTEFDDPAQGIRRVWLFLVDASNGNILYEEDLICHFGLSGSGISGNVSGMTTTGWGADTCGGIAVGAMPYARVEAGGNFYFADVNGNFIVPTPGPVTLTSEVRGQFFRVINTTTPGGGNSVLTQNASAPGPANFLFNAANDSQYKRAEVNAYIHSNVVRDYVLAFNPTFPSVSTETNFPVNVNINLTCNAFYDPFGQSINFYVSGGGCTNTANSTVVHHEYGHRVVNAAGSGQGSYGEGMSDCLAVLITDQPCLGNGFNAPCGTCLRDADNDCQFVSSTTSTPCNSSCGVGGHACGRLISGCLWSTRNYLAATHPATYRSIISALTINSVLLHTGTAINPQITIDFLTLDDNDADISNGTPHYNQINAGFSDHNMPGPALALMTFSYPNGRPALISPSGGTTMRVVVNALAGTPQPNTGKLFVDTGSGFVESSMTEISPNVYDAVFPPVTCGATVRYYVAARSTNNITMNSPGNAPASSYESRGGTGSIGAYADNFQTDQGWSITNSAGIVSGQWQRATPNPACVSRGAPGSDADGSGMCFVTQNAPPPNPPTGTACDLDIDGGTTTLTSPMMDASTDIPILSYSRWYTNFISSNTANQQDDPFFVEISINDGQSWFALETVGPLASSPTPVVLNQWVHRSFNLLNVPGFSYTSQFRIRFRALDTGTGSIVEAGVDNLRLDRILCTPLPPQCPPDVNGDQTVGVPDLLAVIAAWGSCQAPPAGCPADVAPAGGDGNVGVPDLLVIIGAWGPCP